MGLPDESDLVPTRRRTPSAGVAPRPAAGLSDATFAQMLAAGARPEIGPWKPPPPAVLQRQLPQFEMTSLLGHGGMGAVYKAWQHSLDRFVAIKILRGAVESSDFDFAARFEREAKSMARLKHPNIVQVHDAGETAEGLLYFVMDYVDGTDLQKTLAARKFLPRGEALRIASQLCDALAYAHRHGVIHRDIKPSNILLDREERVHIADFGIAYSNHPDGAPSTQRHVALGTPGFIAPEAHLGMNHVGLRGDLYAVGVVLYLMLTGELPQSRYRPPSQRAPGLDARVDAIVERALQSEPERRYASATEMRAELELALAGPPPPPRVPEPRRPVRLQLAAAGGVSLLAVGALFLVARGRNPELPPPPAIGSASASAGSVLRLWDGPAKVFGKPGVEWENGAVRLDQASLVAEAGASRDAVLRAEVRMNPDAVSPQIGLRSLGRPGEENERRYLLGIARLRTEMVELVVCEGRQYQVLAKWPLPRAYGPEEWATLELRTVGDELTASLDQRVLGVVHDQSILEPGAAVLSAAAVGYFRNIVYEPLGKKP